MAACFAFQFLNTLGLIISATWDPDGAPTGQLKLRFSETIQQVGLIAAANWNIFNGTDLVRPVADGVMQQTAADELTGSAFVTVKPDTQPARLTHLADPALLLASTGEPIPSFATPVTLI